MAKTCSTGCGRTVLARGWCATHYQRWHTNGDPGPVHLLRVPGSADRTEKPCKTCGEVKPISEYYGDKRTRDKTGSDCKSCFGVKNQQRRVQRVYNLDEPTRQQMMFDQDHRCAMCGEESKLVIDHCHRSGKVRALLCDRCNRLLGVADDNIDLLKAAIAFLEVHTQE